MWEYYQEKTIFITGATGSLGTAVLCRLITHAAPKRVYVLCRGGQERARAKWTGLLNAAMAATLLHDSRITVLSGDITLDNMGMSKVDWQLLEKSANVIIHAASSINLQSPLKRLSSSIIAPTLLLAKTAVEFACLQRFVFVSTAYANTHLWKLSQEPDVMVKECIYPLCNDRKVVDPQNNLCIELGAQALEEWASVQKTGTSKEFESYNFPWAYAYAKHLSERLLLQTFAQHNALEKLLIVRPSIFGPAISQPYPGFSSAWSTPSAALAAFAILYTGRGSHMNFASRTRDPYREATIDEVPVDVVVDRLLSHLAFGTVGCVHAVSGKRDRSSLGDWWYALMQERRLPWDVKPVWTSLDWHSPKLHPIARLYVIIGTSFDFREDQTEELLASLNAHEKLHMRLFADGHRPDDLQGRRHQIHQMALFIGRKKHIPSCVVKLLCHPVGKRGQRSTCQYHGGTQNWSEHGGARGSQK